MTGKILHMILNTKFGLSGIDADYSKKAISGGYHQLRSFQCCHFLLHFQDSESLTAWSVCIS